ncbi:MAG TPA: hypothetical protein VGK16_04935 [Candidatus Limnocylindrales bacterium]|jgi:hypothetical protein
MNISLAGWSPAGLAAAILIVAGIGLLAAYILRRGLDSRELDGTDPDLEPPEATPAPVPPGGAAPSRGRTVGVVGATLLVAGLALGVVSAATGWGSGTVAIGGPGGGTGDCAQAWNGCPQVTPNP